MLGQGPIGSAQSARRLKQHLDSGPTDKTLAPLVAEIEHRAVRAAALKAINGKGRINHANRFAADLIPGLADLAVSELLRLKLQRFLSRFSEAR